MLAILHLVVMFVADIFKSRRRLEAENLFLRHQLNIALRQAPPRLRLRGSDRALLVWMTRLWPSLIGAAQVVQPETILRWHRAGWKAFWRWKSQKRAGRPKIDRGLRDLIRRMSKENPVWPRHLMSPSRRFLLLSEPSFHSLTKLAECLIHLGLDPQDADPRFCLKDC
jgi:hypothetical protein